MLKGGLINLVIKPEVSEIDTSTTVTVAGTSVPGLITRRASTTLELRDGQSFMLGGLLQNTSQTAQDQLPWIGDAPVIGALFRSSQYQKKETDLVIVVTPHIVHPLAPTQTVHTPLDNTLPAQRCRLLPDGPGRSQSGAGAPRRRRAQPALCRPHPRPAEEWSDLCLGSRIETSVERAASRIVAAVALLALLAGCSDLYFDRRDTIALGAGDALAANAVEQMVDPWPAHSGDTAIPGDGNKMQAAVERYRKNKVTQPVDAMAAVSPTTPSTASSGSSGSSTSSSSSTTPSQHAMTAIVISTRQRV